MKTGTPNATMPIFKVRKNAAIIFNPAAGRARGERVTDAFCACLKQIGLNHAVFRTNHPGHAREIASTMLEEFDVVAGIGGDGTINEIINGLADSGSSIPLLPVPAGTANVVARELGLPRDLPTLAALLAQSPERRLDLGHSAQRRFAMCAGAGFDARVVRKVSAGRGGEGITMLSYAKPFLQELFTYPFVPISVTIDGAQVCDDSTFVVIGNMRQYGGPLRIFNDAQVDDGVFEVCCFRGQSKLSLLGLGLRALWHNVKDSPQTRLFKGKNIVLASEQPVATQLDGDCGPDLPAEFSVLPGAVRFCVSQPR